MAVFKCKMCGGTLEIQTGTSVAVCDFCGTQQTIPKLDDDRRANLYDRANHFRRNNEYDKATSIYEQILNEDIYDAEAYWSLVLCKYGIEYVEDPSTHKRIPTVNRMQYDGVAADANYRKALEYADARQRSLYEQEARTIDGIQKGILEISAKEEPFDVFICYKETDNAGRRTQDSVLANDLYHQLTQEGFRVFFSRITLEDKLGTAYEPYIFAALNSAKVMVVLGTKPEYFNAVWVKNEWSRYLSLIRSGAKKTLIPAYKDMDPYDLPDEFSHLQAQDMSKLGFMQDLIRGIQKLSGAEKAQSSTVQTTFVTQGGGNQAALLTRGTQALEDNDWKQAEEFFDRVLDVDAECAECFFGKALASNCSKNANQLRQCLVDKAVNASQPNTHHATLTPELDAFYSEQRKQNVHGYFSVESIVSKLGYFDTKYQAKVETLRQSKTDLLQKINNDRNIGRAIRYAKGEYRQQIQSFLKGIEDDMNAAIVDAESEEQKTVQALTEKYHIYCQTITQEVNKAHKVAVEKRDADYKQAEECVKGAMKHKNIDMLYTAISLLDKMNGYGESKALINQAKQSICKQAKECIKSAMKHKSTDMLYSLISLLEKMNGYGESKALTSQAYQSINKLKKAAMRKKRFIKMAIAAAVIVAVVGIALLSILVIIPSSHYNQAVKLINSGDYAGASEAFYKAGSYKDAKERMVESIYAYGETLMGRGDYAYASDVFVKSSEYGYKDSATYAIYAQGMAAYAKKDYTKALTLFKSIKGYRNVDDLLANDIRAAKRAEYTTVGNVIRFGSYEQDNNKSNGKEDIEWIVLTAENDKVLLVSKYGLDTKPYNETMTDITWEKCTLRSWLNKDFLKSAFTTTEQSSILLSNVKAEKNPEYSTDPGKDTKDKVFLLSVNEANKYFSNDEARRCQATKYALAGKVRNFNSWWLRSPGFTSSYAAAVADYGVFGSSIVDDDEGMYDYGDCVVRPAIWLNLDSVLLQS